VRAQSAAPLRVGRSSASNFLLDAKPPLRGAALCFGARVQAPPKSYRHLGVAFLPWGKNMLSAPPHFTSSAGAESFRALDCTSSIRRWRHCVMPAMDSSYIAFRHKPLKMNEGEVEFIAFHHVLIAIYINKMHYIY